MRIPKGGIAFFDSGIGGMTVLAECEKFFKNEIFYYYGDNFHAPYGNLPIRKIKKYVHRAFKLFQSLKVKAVVIACNTVTAVCIDELRKKYPFPIIGMEPALMKALKLSQNNDIYNIESDENLHLQQEANKKILKQTIYVLMTRATYNSDRFHALYVRANNNHPNALVKFFACDGLAGAIERHVRNADFDYAAILPKGNPSLVVLGCTHYLYIKKQLEKYYQCPTVDGNEGTAKQLLAVINSSKNWVSENCKNNQNLEKHKKNLKRKPIVTTSVPDIKEDGKKIEIIEKTKTNKCFHFLRKLSKPLITKRGQNSIYFCGSGRGYNALFYKQMFVFNQKME